MEFWTFIFYGKNNEDLHGITFREEIKKIASNLGVLGNVKNIKRNGTVEVICEVKTSSVADQFYNQILSSQNPMISEKIDPQKSKRTQLSFDPEENSPKFEDFNIIREDELAEMVWALQGAGRVFALQGEIRNKNLNRSLKYGINSISECAAQLLTNGKPKRKFTLLAIDNYITECPSNDRIIMINLYDLHQMCEDVNAIISSNDLEKEKAKLDDSLRKIIDICASVEKSFDKV